MITMVVSTLNILFLQVYVKKNKKKKTLGHPLLPDDTTPSRCGFLPHYRKPTLVTLIPECKKKL